MSTQSKAWLWRCILVVVQLLVIPLVVYAATVTRDRDMRELQQHVAERYLSLAAWRDYIEDHEARTQERIASIRAEIKASHALLLQEVRSVGAQVEELSRRLNRRGAAIER